MVFSLIFLILTWNLGCRVNNTVHIKFRDISWANSFDCFQILFAHSTTDPTGEESSYPRHIFGYPTDPIRCPLLSLAMYFTSCFSGKKISREDYLFPGSKQEHRFAKILHWVLSDNQDEVHAMGYKLNQIERVNFVFIVFFTIRLP
jgi:hypothetical protein